MGPSQLIVSGIMSLLAYAVIIIAVFKIFAISSELAEIKEILKNVQRNTEDNQSAAPLLHAVNSASYPDVEVEHTTEVLK